MTKKRYNKLMLAVCSEMVYRMDMPKQSKKAFYLNLYKCNFGRCDGKSYAECFDMYRKWARENIGARV